MKTRILMASIATLLLFSCQGKIEEFQKETGKQFSDQSFKTTISLIEMYKLRHGYYPATLDSLEFVGDWDKGSLNWARYKKLNEGYELDINFPANGSDSIRINYPAKFWKGLGIKKSNLTNIPVDSVGAKAQVAK